MRKIFGNYLEIYLFIYLSIYLFIYLSIYLFILSLFQAVDQDRQASVTYSIVQGDTGFFAVDESTGRISTRVGLDYETKQQYEFIVSTREALAEGEEGTGPQYSATVTVNVLVSDVVFYAVSVSS